MRSNNYIICQKKKATDTDGYLCIIAKGRGQRKRKSLGLKVNLKQFGKYWNEREQRFRSGMPQYKSLNEEIDNVFSELAKTNDTITARLKNKTSFVKFWDDSIAEIENHNSRIKIEVIKNKFMKYLLSVGMKDIQFSQLNPDFIKNLQKYFKTAQDPGKLSTNSATHYLKVVKMAISKKLESDPNVFTIHPFTGIKYDPWNETERVVLDDHQISILLNAELADPKVNLNRDKFLFQIFAQGMRVSDLLLLRWSNIHTSLKMPRNDNELPSFVYFSDNDPQPYISDRKSDVLQPQIKYRMFKTNSLVEVPITYNLCVILAKLIGMEHIIYEGYDTTIYLLGDKYEIFKEKPDLTLPEMEERIIELCGNTELNENDKLTNYKGYTFNSKITGMEEAIDYFEGERKAAADMFIRMTMYCVAYYVWKNKCSNDFVFPHLKNQFFRNIDSSKGWKLKLSFEQNKKLLNGEHLYNRQLKQVANECGLVKNLVSHTGRHSFVQLLLNEDAPTHIIMDALRHKNLATTDKYIRNKSFNKGETDYVSLIGNKDKYRKF